MGKGREIFKSGISHKEKYKLLKELVMYILGGNLSAHRRVMLKQRAREIWSKCYDRKDKDGTR